jgi:PhnB protein
MKSVNPYINFNGNCEEAFEFYQSVFGGELRIVRFRDMENDMGVTGDDRNKIANIALPLNENTLLLGSDVLESFGQPVEAGNRFQIHLEAESVKEVEQLFNDLSNDAEVKMPLQQTEWAEKFGMCADKFGVQWMMMYSGKNN